MQKSRVFIYNGGGLEPWVDRILPELRSRGVVVVNSSTSIPVITNNSSIDPHFWLDPIFAQIQVQNITRGLIEADPGYQDQYLIGSQNLTVRLSQLDQQFRHGLSVCSIRKIITSHSAFTYLGERYGLQVYSIAGISPDQEPSSQKLAQLSQIARDQHIKYIFFETLVNPSLSQTLAREVGASTLVFNPLEGLSPNQQAVGENYFSVQTDNLKNLKIALQCL
jgi:zinc transport system substrate-binding protein